MRNRLPAVARGLVCLLLVVIPCLAFPGSHARAAAPPVPEAPDYLLNISFDIPAARVFGTAAVKAAANRELIFRTGELSIQEVSLDRSALDFVVDKGVLRIVPPADGVLSIRYEGVFAGGAVETFNYGVVDNAIREEGISLTGLWYPRPEGLAVYRLRATLLQGYTALSEAEESATIVEGNTLVTTFNFPYPVDGISFIASPRYEVTAAAAKGVRLFAYFFPEERALAAKYLDYAKGYLSRYEALLGPYPYRRFSVVENFLPSGYSLPTFTLLGRDVVRLPFIVETSLGHEILHQWFGNYVYVDYEKGNWAEGLTTYLADHAYEEQKGRGWEYRKRLLIDYRSHVNEKDEAPLSAFRGRDDYASKALGYGKAALVFHMLRRQTGDEKFYEALRRFIARNAFRPASWDDLKSAFGAAGLEEPDRFFGEWITRPGLLELTAKASAVKQRGDRYETTVSVSRAGSRHEAAAPLAVPVFFHYPDGTVQEETLTLKDTAESRTFTLSRMPSRIVLDEDYDLPRRLTGNELPPVIARLIGAEKPLVVLPDEGGAERYAPVIDYFASRGGSAKKAGELKDAEIKTSTLVLLGSDNPLLKRLFGSLPSAGGFSVTVKENPWNPRQVVGVFDAASAEETGAAFRKIFHYGGYSMLVFEKGKNVDKGIQESARGVVLWERQRTTALDVSTLTTLSAVIEAVAGKKIVYVGEFHDRPSHHQVQLEVIQGLYKKNPLLAIGMEMFQRPFQRVLDDFIAGRIDEREFLKKSEYFPRWSFDYTLYKPILSFAREKKIPVVALNLQREIIEKVAKGGLDALNDEERKGLPAEIDVSDAAYRERLEQVFRLHGRGGHGSTERSFDNFFLSQILWDETMSRSIDEFFRTHPAYEKDGQMVVIAGGGHLAYGSGIPKRTFRRNAYPYAIVLNDADVEKGIADYLVFPEELEIAAAPKIMAVLEEEGGTVRIKEFPEHSISAAAGLRPGDVILALDGAPVAAVDDVRIHLLYKKKGEPLAVRVLRKRFLRGDTVMEFTVPL